MVKHGLVTNLENVPYPSGKPNVEGEYLMIKILLFAQLQDEIGVESLELELSNITVTQLKQELITKFQFPSLEHTMVAVNEEYALEEDTIQSGDVVAFIPPVSGG